MTSSVLTRILNPSGAKSQMCLLVQPELLLFWGVK